MKFTAKLFSTILPASDGSLISRDVAETFFNSQEFKEALEARKLFGTLTHIARNLQAAKNCSPAVPKTIGKDDLLLLIGENSPTHVLTKVWFENDGWCHGEFDVLSEDGLDDEAVQRIRRVKGLLRNGCRIGISCVILGYWDNQSGNDYLKKFVALKGADLTLNPSWKNAGIEKIDLEDGSEEKTFSELDIEYDPEAYKDNKIRVKQFSDLSAIGCGEMVKSSKIGGKFTTLKAKSFSFNSEVSLVSENETKEKEFSVTALRERVREKTRYSPRQKFRMLVLSYRQLIRQSGGIEKMDPKTVSALKSLFAMDILDLMKEITPDIMAGKNPGTLLGASSLGKGVRQAVQALFLPYKMALSEVSKTGAVTKNRYQKLQKTYLDFVDAMIEEVFGPGASKTKEPAVMYNAEEPEVEEGDNKKK